MVVLRIGDAPAAVVAAMARFIETIRLVAAQAMVMLRVGDAPAAVVAAMARFIETIRLVAAQTMVMLRVGHPSAAVIATAAGLVDGLGLLSAESLIAGTSDAPLAATAIIVLVISHSHSFISFYLVFPRPFVAIRLASPPACCLCLFFVLRFRHAGS
jgi:hypothetical protein